MKRVFYLISTLVLGLSFTQAQTVLSPGDIAFLGLQSTNSVTPPGEGFAFILLTDAAPGTVINFTDNQYSPPNFCSGEGVITWTNTTGLTLNRFTVIEIRFTNTTTPTLIPAGYGSVVRTGAFDIESNDVIYAYQGVSGSPVFIAEISNGDSWGNCNNCGNGSPSCLAPDLAEGESAVRLENPQGPANNDNGFYSGPINTGSVDELRALLYNPANWTASSGPQIWPTFSFILPVKFTGFKAVKDNDKVRLNWTVAEEISVDGYEVERSSNGVNFSGIGYVDATGSSGYGFVDDKMLNGVNYYRVKNIDLDGKFAYSHIVSVNGQRGSFIRLFPVPAHDRINIQHSEAGAGAEIKINSLDGRLVRVQKVPRNSVQSSIELNNIPPGMYFLSYDSGNGEQLKERFIKQ